METHSVKLYALYYAQDDPKKNTVVKLKKFNLIKIVKSLKSVPRAALILDPFSEKTIDLNDRDLIQRNGLVVIDCSWNKASEIFRNKFRTGRKLPDLLAANAVNYGKWNKLSSAEAIAAALIITGFIEDAEQILSKFKWGETFKAINSELFEESAKNMRRGGFEPSNH